MGARGPKSGAELTVIGASGVVAVHRPDPPRDLAPDQAAEWRTIVNTYAADRFPVEQHPMLAAHCRHSSSARLIAQMMDECLRAEPFDMDHYDRLLKMQERESRCLASLAVRLGFAYSTAYEKRATKKGPSLPRWHEDAG